jgi:hypothetical protein
MFVEPARTADVVRARAAAGALRATGLSAPVVARNPRRREAVVAWSLFGLGDLGDCHGNSVAGRRGMP